MTPEDFDKLATEIRVRRACGRVWVKRLVLERSTTACAQDRADAFVTSLGLTPVSWVDITRDEAQAGAALILHQGRAYDGQVMPAADASRLAEDFLGFFTEHDGYELRYFTNGTLIQPCRGADGRGWSALTSATFDCGIIVVAKKSIGILWVADED